MARPKKNNADYHSHDSNMRNDPRIKAIRNKYKHTGYAIWNYLLEVLTDSDYFRIEWSDINIEILAGDFDVSPEELIDIVGYCLRLKLLQEEDGFLICQKHQDNFSGLLTKRENRGKKKVSDIQNPKPDLNIESFGQPKPQSNIVTGVHNPQRKVKESKVKESKEEEDKESTKDLPHLPPITLVEAEGNDVATHVSAETERTKKVPQKKEERAEECTAAVVLEDENYIKFKIWIKEKAPSVAKFKEEFTEKEFLKLREEFTGDYMAGLLLDMHNSGKVPGGKISANLTFRNWVKRRKEWDNEATKQNTANKGTDDNTLHERKFGSMQSTKASIIADMQRSDRDYALRESRPAGSASVKGAVSNTKSGNNFF